MHARSQLSNYEGLAPVCATQEGISFVASAIFEIIALKTASKKEVSSG